MSTGAPRSHELLLNYLHSMSRPRSERVTFAAVAEVLITTRPRRALLSDDPSNASTPPPPPPPSIFLSKGPTPSLQPVQHSQAGQHRCSPRGHWRRLQRDRRARDRRSPRAPQGGLPSCPSSDCCCLYSLLPLPKLTPPIPPPFSLKSPTVAHPNPSNMKKPTSTTTSVALRRRTAANATETGSSSLILSYRYSNVSPPSVALS